MKIFIAEDDKVSRRLLEAQLGKWGHEMVAVGDGVSAWEALRRPEAPALVILDWMMPGIDGLEVCRRLRGTPDGNRFYIIILTAKGLREDIVAGLSAGANDFVMKPFDQAELRARIQVGVRLIELQQQLSHRVQELEEALAKIKTLQGLLPICAWCKKIRSDQNYWEKVETYLGRHTDARFTHSICPDCHKQQMEQMAQNRASRANAPAVAGHDAAHK